MWNNQYKLKHERKTNGNYRTTTEKNRRITGTSKRPPHRKIQVGEFVGRYSKKPEYYQQ